MSRDICPLCGEFPHLSLRHLEIGIRKVLVVSPILCQSAVTFDSLTDTDHERSVLCGTPSQLPRSKP
jgi:hypothetical protein